MHSVEFAEPNAHKKPILTPLIELWLSNDVEAASLLSLLRELPALWLLTTHLHRTDKSNWVVRSQRAGNKQIIFLKRKTKRRLKMREEQSKSNIRFTERDIAIIQFVNEFGFCELSHIEKRFCLSRPYSYEVMKRLKLSGFIHHQRIFHLRPGVYFLSGRAAQHTSLPAIEKISVGQYEHQLCILDVYLKLQQQYSDAQWVSERRLKHDKFRDGLGKHGHVSDGILTMADGRQIAIEVELSVKGKNRIEKILKNYAAQFSFSEVWYYCSPAVMNVLTPLAKKMPFIKIYNLSEFLSC